MTDYDLIAEANGDDECRAWVRGVIDAKADIVAFVDCFLDGGETGKFVGFLKGSFNVSLRISFDDRRQSALIRFPKPGHTIWRDEKVTNEVCFMEYLSQHTSIPIPHVLGWGLGEQSPQQLGPFIIMEFIDGTHLSTVLKQPTNDEHVVLDPDIEDATLDVIYDHLADYLLQIFRLNFPRIGAISKDQVSDTWPVTGRPLTYNMNELATSTGYPVDQFPTIPFGRVSEVFREVASEHLTHLQTQRNLADDTEDASEAVHRPSSICAAYLQV